MNLAQKAEQLFDLPSGALTGDVRLELEGRTRLTADGDTVIISYDENHVCFMTRSGAVRVSGEALVLESFRSSGVAVRGNLLMVEFL